MKVANTQKGWRGALRTLTVKELIEVLEAADPDMPVVFASDYGDYHHTIQVHAIDGTVEEEPIHESAYSRSGWAVPTHERERAEDDEEEEDAVPRVLVIR